MDGSGYSGPNGTGFGQAPRPGLSFARPALPDGRHGAPGAAPDPDTLLTGPRFQVRQLHLPVGAGLGPQAHLHRATQWIVVQGTARITMDGVCRLVAEGGAISVPLGQVHRLDNPGRLPLVLIAVETGPYLGEDDVIWHD